VRARGRRNQNVGQCGALRPQQHRPPAEFNGSKPFVSHLAHHTFDVEQEHLVTRRHAGDLHR
jgi:hypothetical protein